MTKSIYQSLALTFVSFLFLSPSSAHDKSLPVDYKGSFSQVFAFGDSYTDTGNAKFLGGINASVDAKNIPLEKLIQLGYVAATGGDPMTNSKLVLDFLCDALSLGTPNPYKDPSANFSVGVNFAIAGSTSIPKDLFLGNNLSSLIWQALLFWIGQMGVSDYTRALGSSVSLQWLSEISVRSVGKLLKTLLHAGAKYIVVQGLPPVGCLPIDISLCPLKNLDKMGCASAINSGVMIYNQILTILTNPKKYGIEEPFKACCGAAGSNMNFNNLTLCGSPSATVCKDPSKYISWDGIHLTEAMYKHVTDLFLNQGFCQPPFDELIKNKKSM